MSRSVGQRDGWSELFPTDEEQFANLQVWKNLLRTCREKLRDGEIEGNGCRFEEMEFHNPSDNP